MNKPMPKSEVLSILARADDARLKALADGLIAPLGEIEVVQNRTGLVMLPMRDTVKGGAFHLGEVLVAEAHIRSAGTEGYGMRRGRDLEAAMAMALIDLAMRRGIARAQIDEFLTEEATAQTLADQTTLRCIEATRVQMETF